LGIVQEKICTGGGKTKRNHRKAWGLLKLKELLSEATPEDLRHLGDCDIAIFPNPSGANARWKSHFYRTHEDAAKRILKHVRGALGEPKIISEA
jgi:hypothetical protein